MTVRRRSHACQAFDIASRTQLGTPVVVVASFAKASGSTFGPLGSGIAGQAASGVASHTRVRASGTEGHIVIVVARLAKTVIA